MINKKNSHPIPIELLNSIDLILTKKDGTVELVIIGEGYLDGSISTQKRILDKVNNYLTFIESEEYKEEFGTYAIDKTIIILKCPVPDPAITELVNSIKLQLASYNVGFRMENF